MLVHSFTMNITIEDGINAKPIEKINENTISLDGLYSFSFVSIKRML